MPRFVGCDKSALHENFIYNAFEVIEGRHITSGDAHCALVSEVFANLNGFTAGDRFEACLDSVITQDETMPEEVYSLEIVGIYTIHEGWQVTPMTPERDIAENFIFTDTLTVELKAADLLLCFAAGTAATLLITVSCCMPIVRQKPRQILSSL